MRIHHLADYQCAIPQIAQWLYDEFGKLHPDASIIKGISKLNSRIIRGKIPCTLVAVKDDNVIGTVSLVDCDMESRIDLHPWLASLFVTPEWRRQGVGSMLINSLVREAKQLNIKTLYLFTDTSESLYAKVGWSTIESCLYNGKNVVIMSYYIAQQGDAPEPATIADRASPSSPSPAR